MQPEFLLLALPACLFFLTWVVYLATMNLVRNRESMTGLPLMTGWAVFCFGVALSTTMNWLVFTFLLLEFPREFTLSARLSRHLKAGGWRGRQAALIAEAWLDRFDPSGKHV